MARVFCDKSMRVFGCLCNITRPNQCIVRKKPSSIHAAVRCMSSNDSPGQWHLWSAVCLERIPIITQEKTKIEQDFQEMLLKLEDDKSKMSSHELRHIEDELLAKRRKQDDFEETEADSILVTAQEDEDTWQAELENFTPAERITEADESNDTKSTNRRLDRKLVLLVKQILGNSNPWIFPQTQRKDGETMRQCAERALLEACGTNISASFLGNAPCGFLKYQYPKNLRKESGPTGAMVFFFKAHMQEGQVEQTPLITDYLWMTTEEMTQYISKQYSKEVNKFILDFSKVQNI